MKLRDYQTKSITMLYDWMAKNSGHPCVVLPTGAGKSIVIAELLRGAVQEWPDTRALMLCAQKEILEQNAEKMRALWPAAPMGIYHAGMRRRDLGEPITFAGIQSIRNRAADVGHIDICVVDEAHMIGHEDEGSFRRFIGELMGTNPQMRVIGFSGTPYRLGHGLITDKPALFDGLVEPVSVAELLAKGHLSPLSCKATTKKFNTSTIHTRGGEFIESELQKLVDTQEQNDVVADEILANATDRKSWLLFCTGVDHAEHMRDALRARGIATECITGETQKGERERVLADFKAGKVQAITNANVLTTGFDAPCVDLIAFCRPTLSTALYMQMAGRGLRKAPGKADCLVLDFAGLVHQHGTITEPRYKKVREGSGEAPVKVCDACAELVPISLMVCPACGAPFPAKDPEPVTLQKPHLQEFDIIHGINPDDVKILEVTEWAWKRQTARSGKDMLTVTYYGCLSDRPVTEYLTVLHEGYAGRAAWSKVAAMGNQVAAHLPEGLLASGDLDAVCVAFNKAPHPSEIRHTTDGKFHTITRRTW
jgi:DNA repair protein RadD